MSSSRFSARSSDRTPSELERTAIVFSLIGGRFPRSTHATRRGISRLLAALVDRGKVARRVAFVALEPPRRAQQVLPALLCGGGAAGERLGVRRVAAEQPG